MSWVLGTVGAHSSATRFPSRRHPQTLPHPLRLCLHSGGMMVKDRARRPVAMGRPRRGRHDRGRVPSKALPSRFIPSARPHALGSTVRLTVCPTSTRTRIDHARPIDFRTRALIGQRPPSHPWPLSTKDRPGSGVVMVAQWEDSLICWTHNLLSRQPTSTRGCERQGYATTGRTSLTGTSVRIVSVSPRSHHLPPCRSNPMPSRAHQLPEMRASRIQTHILMPKSGCLSASVRGRGPSHLEAWVHHRSRSAHKCQRSPQGSLQQTFRPRLVVLRPSRLRGGSRCPCNLRRLLPVDRVRTRPRNSQNTDRKSTISPRNFGVGVGTWRGHQAMKMTAHSLGRQPPPVDWRHSIIPAIRWC